MEPNYNLNKIMNYTKKAAILTVATIGLAACTQRLCPTYAQNDAYKPQKIENYDQTQRI